MIEESCKSNSQLSVESNAEVYWFCLVLLHANHTPDWCRKLGPLYQLFIFKGNWSWTNRDSIICVFSLFRSFSCFCFEFLVASCDIPFVLIGRQGNFCFGFKTLSKNASLESCIHNCCQLVKFKRGINTNCKLIEKQIVINKVRKKIFTFLPEWHALRVKRSITTIRGCWTILIAKEMTNVGNVTIFNHETT